MLETRLKALVVSTALIAMPWFLWSCSKGTEEARRQEPQPRVEPAVAPIAPILPPAPPTPTPSLGKKSTTPPDPKDVQAAVARVFDKVATADTSRSSNFALGDFNGDGSEDLAVAVNAGEGALKEINNELANWVLEDPRTVPIPSAAATARTSPGKPVRAGKGDTLLAIIHGVGAQGWRAPEAKQTFVLKNAAGSKLLPQSPDEIRKSIRQGPPLRGDVLNETVGGKSGFVFWTGAKYAWWASPSN